MALVKVSQFINGKAKQLAYFVRAFWQGKLPSLEMDLYLWDTLEEWGQLKVDGKESYTKRERVFWHLLHEVHRISEDDLKKNPALQKEIMCYVKYLEGNEDPECSVNRVVGIRPGEIPN